MKNRKKKHDKSSQSWLAIKPKEGKGNAHAQKTRILSYPIVSGNEYLSKDTEDFNFWFYKSFVLKEHNLKDV